MDEERTHLIESEGMNDSNMAVLRLDTNPLLTQIEAHLRSAKPVYRADEYGNTEVQYQTVGEALANDFGINIIMSICRMHINSQVVQGNFNKDEFWESTAEFIENFAQSVITNRHNWGIKINNVKTIIDNVSMVIEKFASRTVNNLERESYNRSTFQQTQVHKKRPFFKRREEGEI